MSDKTLDPTPRRLRKAREEGDSGLSAFAAQSVAFVAAVALAPSAVRSLALYVSADLRGAIAMMGAAPPPAHFEAARFDPIALATTVLALTLPVLAAAAIASAIVLGAQTGGVFASKRIGLRFERLNPIAGMKGLISGPRMFAVVRSVVAGGVVGYLAWGVLRERLGDLSKLSGRLPWVGIMVAETSTTLAWRVAVAGLALGLVDLAVTRRAWLARLRMSKDEVKREHKESEGDPEHKAARDRAYRELVAQATIGSVRSATVVVVNPTHLACALRYDEKEGDEAPVVVASGEGDLASRIVQAARDYGVPVIRDIPLARALLELEVGDVIPEALYEAVAEILREIWEHEEKGVDEI